MPCYLQPGRKIPPLPQAAIGSQIIRHHCIIVHPALPCRQVDIQAVAHIIHRMLVGIHGTDRSICQAAHLAISQPCMGIHISIADGQFPAIACPVVGIGIKKLMAGRRPLPAVVPQPVLGAGAIPQVQQGSLCLYHCLKAVIALQEGLEARLVGLCLLILADCHILLAVQHILTVSRQLHLQLNHIPAAVSLRFLRLLALLLQLIQPLTDAVKILPCRISLRLQLLHPRPVGINGSLCLAEPISPIAGAASRCRSSKAHFQLRQAAVLKTGFLPCRLNPLSPLPLPEGQSAISVSGYFRRPLQGRRLLHIQPLLQLRLGLVPYRQVVRHRLLACHSLLSEPYPLSPCPLQLLCRQAHLLLRLLPVFLRHAQVLGSLPADALRLLQIALGQCRVLCRLPHILLRQIKGTDICQIIFHIIKIAIDILQHIEGDRIRPEGRTGSQPCQKSRSRLLPAVHPLTPLLQIQPPPLNP